MDLRHIRYLKAVVDHGSFTRAAQALHVSQPALSQQVKELELRLGAQLLDRSGRQIRPTDLGTAYLRHVDRALEELEEATRAVRDVEDLSTGSLRLGVTPSVALAYAVIAAGFFALGKYGTSTSYVPQHDLPIAAPAE